MYSLTKEPNRFNPKPPPPWYNPSYGYRHISKVFPPCSSRESSVAACPIFFRNWPITSSCQGTESCSLRSRPLVCGLNCSKRNFRSWLDGICSVSIFSKHFRYVSTDNAAITPYVNPKCIVSGVRFLKRKLAESRNTSAVINIARRSMLSLWTAGDGWLFGFFIFARSTVFRFPFLNFLFRNCQHLFSKCAELFFKRGWFGFAHIETLRQEFQKGNAP